MIEFSIAVGAHNHSFNHHLLGNPYGVATIEGFERTNGECALGWLRGATANTHRHKERKGYYTAEPISVVGYRHRCEV